jgi:hypothetical protein
MLKRFGTMGQTSYSTKMSVTSPGCDGKRTIPTQAAAPTATEGCAAAWGSGTRVRAVLR